MKLGAEHILPMPPNLQRLPPTAYRGGLAKCIPIEKVRWEHSINIFLINLLVNFLIWYCVFPTCTCSVWIIVHPNTSSTILSVLLIFRTLTQSNCSTKRPKFISNHFKKWTTIIFLVTFKSSSTPAAKWICCVSWWNVMVLKLIKMTFHLVSKSKDWFDDMRIRKLKSQPSNFEFNLILFKTIRYRKLGNNEDTTLQNRPRPIECSAKGIRSVIKQYQEK